MACSIDIPYSQLFRIHIIHFSNQKMLCLLYMYYFKTNTETYTYLIRNKNIYIQIHMYVHVLKNTTKCLFAFFFWVLYFFAIYVVHLYRYFVLTLLILLEFQYVIAYRILKCQQVQSVSTTYVIQLVSQPASCCVQQPVKQS